MKMTLLEIVQDILNDISSDFVNSIDDTEESMQVAQIVKSTYQAMMSNRNWPHLKRGLVVVPYSDSSKPTHMKVVEDIKELLSINYDIRKGGETRKRFTEIRWLEPDSFLRKVNQEDNTKSYVDTVQDPSGIELFIRKDKSPQFYTSFDDNTLVFDSYDNSVDATLQQSKVQAYGYVFPSWTHLDGFVPDLPAEAFSALVEEAKSKASLKLNQSPDQKAEQESGRQQRWLARKGWQISGGIKYPNYGRRPRK